VDAARISLYVVGGVLELGGIALVGAPDVFPAVAAGWRWVRSRPALVAGSLRRLLRRPRIHTVSATAAMSASASMRASVIRGIDPNGTLVQKVKDLIAHDADAQKRLNTLEQRVTDEEQAREVAIKSAQRDTEERMTEQMRAFVDTYKRWRLVGAGLLIFGAICLNAGNFA
jgi:hypothetical protein